MALFGIEAVTFICIIYLYVNLTSQHKSNASSRSFPLDSILSPVALLLPTTRRNEAKPSKSLPKLLLKLSFINYQDFPELYHGIEMDLLFTSLIVGLLSTMAWGLINWARFLFSGAELVTANADATQDATQSAPTQFIFMRLGWWWTVVSLLYIAGLIYFQLRITWRRHKTVLGFGALVTAFFAWILALIVLFTPNISHLVTWDMDRAFVSLQLYWNMYFENSERWSKVRIPLSCGVIFKFLMSLVCAALSYCMVMPVMRMIRCHLNMHTDLMKQATKNLMLHEYISWINFFLPALVASLWMQPVRDAFSSVDESLFNSLRLYGVYIASILQVFSVKPYLQAFLLRSATDCTKDLDSKKPLTEQQFDQLRDRMLNGMRLTFVVVCQLTFIPFMLMALGLLGNIRGKFSFGLGPPVDVIAGRPETFSFKESIQLSPGDVNARVHAVSLAQSFYTETIGFLWWWILVSQVVLTLASFAMIRLQQRLLPLAADKAR